MHKALKWEEKARWRGGATTSAFDTSSSMPYANPSGAAKILPSVFKELVREATTHMRSFHNWKGFWLCAEPPS